MEGLESMTPLESEKKDLMARLGEIYYKKCKESGNVTAEEAEILEKIARLDQEMPGEESLKKSPDWIRRCQVKIRSIREACAPAAARL